MGVAGSPGGVEAAAGTMGGAGRDLGVAADSIASHGRAVTADWIGSAADAAGAAIAALAGRARVGAGACAGVPPVLRTYAAELRAAQGQYDDGSAAADAGAVALRSATAAAHRAGALAQDDPGRAGAPAAAVRAGDRADAQVRAGQASMIAAVGRAERANAAAAAAIDALTDRLDAMDGATSGASAPQAGHGSPAAAGSGGGLLLEGAVGLRVGWPERSSGVPQHADDAADGDEPWYQRAWHETSVAVAHAARDVEDFTGSVWDYYGDDPRQLGELLASATTTAGGLALMAEGAGMELGGVALDATGIGAVVGVPANIAGVGVIAAGAALTGGGALAMGQNLGTMMQERDTSGAVGGGPGEPGISTRISTQKQSRHVLGGRGYAEGGYFKDSSEAQEVLDAYHSGEARVVRVQENGNILVDYDGATGYNNNVGANHLDQPTHRFIIKGTRSVSVVPTAPGG